MRHPLRSRFLACVLPTLLSCVPATATDCQPSLVRRSEWTVVVPNLPTVFEFLAAHTKPLPPR